MKTAGQTHRAHGSWFVDDTPALCSALARLLGLYGYEVREARDGQQALDRLAGFRPELILTDLTMPGMDGVEFIQRLKADAEFARIPVLVISGAASQEMEKLAGQAGATDIITKPIDLPRLLGQLQALHR